MQFLMPFNYGALILDNNACNELVSVMIGEKKSENFNWGGIINQCDASVDGWVTFFKTNPSFRYGGADDWIYTNDKSTLLAYVKGRTVKVICDDDLSPVFGVRDYSNFHQVSDMGKVIRFPVERSRARF